MYHVRVLFSINKFSYLAESIVIYIYICEKIKHMGFDKSEYEMQHIYYLYTIYETNRSECERNAIMIIVIVCSYARISFWSTNNCTVLVNIFLRNSFLKLKFFLSQDNWFGRIKFQNDQNRFKKKFKFSLCF